MLAGGKEDEKAWVIICMTINKTRTNPAWKAILAGFSCLHNYFLRTEYVKAIIKGVRFELLLI